MSSIYPLVMTWPAEASFGLDTAATAHLVIGGCVGEATMPVLVGAAMHIMGPRALPSTVLALAVVLCLQLALLDCLARRHATHPTHAGSGANNGGGGNEGASIASAPSFSSVSFTSSTHARHGVGGGGGGGVGRKGGKGKAASKGNVESPIRTFDVDAEEEDDDDLEMGGSRLGDVGGREMEGKRVRVYAGACGDGNGEGGM